jgi:prepilin-type processing-associated H-X9-DG protein
VNHPIVNHRQHNAAAKIMQQAQKPMSICGSEGEMADQRRVQTWVIVGVVLGATLFGCFVFGVIMAAIMLPVFTQAREKAKTVTCMSNQRQIARALQMYAADNDVLPAASQWTDKVKPYLRNDYLFVCPSAKQLECGYAFYRPLGNRKVSSISNPAAVPMIFDSSKGQFNYADEGQSLDFRHLNGAVISFVDGHLKWFKESEAKALFQKRP